MTTTAQQQRKQHHYTPKDKAFWKATFALTLASIYVFSSLYAVQPLIPIFVNTFHINPFISSLALSFAIAALILGLIVLGFLSDRHGRLKVMTVGLIGSYIPLFLIPFTDHFWLILVLRVIQGFFLAGLPATAVAYLSEEVEARSIGLAVSFYISSNAFGGMGGRILFGYIADTYTWQLAYKIFIVIGLVVVVAFIALMPKQRHFEVSTETFKQGIYGLVIHLKNKWLLQYFLTGFLLMFIFTGVWTYIPFYLHQQPFSLSYKTISYTYLAYGFGIFSSSIAGRLSQSIGLFRPKLVGMMIMIVGVMLTLIHNIIVIILGLALMCVGFFMAHSMATATVSQLTTHHKGGASSFYLVSYYLGVAIGGSIMAVMWSTFGWLGIAPVSVLLLIVMLVGRDLTR